MTPFFSVIIPTFNRRATLEQCLAALAHQEGGTADVEVIVVDDGSTDDTRLVLEGRSFPFLFTYLTVGREGPGRARNVGAEHAAGMYLAFAEDDVVPDGDWLAAARRHLAGGIVDMLEGRTVQKGDRRDIRRFESVQRPSFIPCNLFVRRDVFLRAGGYDQEFFDRDTGLYFREDADLGFRLTAAGCRIALVHDVVVEHPVQFPDLGSCLRHVRRYVFDPLLYRKHPVLYRRMIEVKSVAGLVIHRPMHYTSLASGLLGTLGVVVVGLGYEGTGAALVAGALFCSWLVRYKYQGWRAIRLHRLGETLGFCILPAVYLGSLFRGCLRFRSFGSLV